MPNQQPQNQNLDQLAFLHHVEKIIEARIDEALALHNAEKSHTLTGIHARLDSIEALIKSGFPNDDPLSHRRVHEGYIKEANDRESMVRGAKQKVIEATLWGALVILASALWDYMKAHIK